MWKGRRLKEIYFFVWKVRGSENILCVVCIFFFVVSDTQFIEGSAHLVIRAHDLRIRERNQRLLALNPYRGSISN